NIPCLRIQRRRSRATSARFCSAAYKVFFEVEAAPTKNPPNRTTAARDSPLPHRRNHLVQRQIRLPGDQTQQKPRMFLQRRCAAATRLCRNASGLLKALGPKHHHTGADPIAFGRLPPRCPDRDVSDHADTQVHGIRPRHRLPPSPNQGGQTRSLTGAWEPSDSTRAEFALAGYARCASRGRRFPISIPLGPRRKILAAIGELTAIARATPKFAGGMEEIADWLEKLGMSEETQAFTETSILCSVRLLPPDLIAERAS